MKLVQKNDSNGGYDEVAFQKVRADQQFKLLPASRFVLQRCCDTSEMVKAVMAPECSQRLLGVPRPGPKPTDIVFVIK